MYGGLERGLHIVLIVANLFKSQTYLSEEKKNVPRAGMSWITDYGRLAGRF